MARLKPEDITAWKPLVDKPVFYIAHPVSTAPLLNAANTVKWTGWLHQTDRNRVHVAPWLGEVMYYGDESIIKPGTLQYSEILQDDLLVVDRLQGVTLVGGVISDGMLTEVCRVLDTGRPVLNLWKYRSPEDLPNGFGQRDIEEHITTSANEILRSVLHATRK